MKNSYFKGFWLSISAMIVVGTCSIPNSAHASSAKMTQEDSDNKYIQGQNLIQFRQYQAEFDTLVKAFRSSRKTIDQTMQLLKNLLEKGQQVQKNLVELKQTYPKISFDALDTIANEIWNQIYHIRMFVYTVIDKTNEGCLICQGSTGDDNIVCRECEEQKDPILKPMLKYDEALRDLTSIAVTTKVTTFKTQTPQERAQIAKEKALKKEREEQERLKQEDKNVQEQNLKQFKQFQKEVNGLIRVFCRSKNDDQSIANLRRLLEKGLQIQTNLLALKQKYPKISFDALDTIANEIWTQIYLTREIVYRATGNENTYCLVCHHPAEQNNVVCKECDNESSLYKYEEALKDLASIALTDHKESKEEKKESKEDKKPKEDLTLPSLKKLCEEKLQEYSGQMEWNEDKNKAKIVSGFDINAYDARIDGFKRRFQSDTNFMSSNKWLAGSAPDEKLFKQLKRNSLPYVQRLIIPVGSIVGFIGDIHGSIHSLLRDLEQLKQRGYLNDELQIIDKDTSKPFYLIFTGDYVDRGGWSSEVLFTLMTLKLINFDRVFLLRGNHEYEETNTTNGFFFEIYRKFNNLNIFHSFNEIFELLPLALYLGVKESDNHTTFIQCCHGGIDPCYDPTTLLCNSKEVTFEKLPLEKAKWASSKYDTIANLLNTFGKSSNMGGNFSWCDFEAPTSTSIFGKVELKPITSSSRGRKNEFIVVTSVGAQNFLALLNEKLTKNNISINGFFRGHQHSNFGLKFSGDDHWIDEVKKQETVDKPYGYAISVAKYGPIFTFSTAAEGVELPYDCFGLLNIGNTYNDWTLKVYEEKRPEIKIIESKKKD